MLFAGGAAGGGPSAAQPAQLAPTMAFGSSLRLNFADASKLDPLIPAPVGPSAVATAQAAAAAPNFDLERSVLAAPPPGDAVTENYLSRAADATLDPAVGACKARGCRLDFALIAFTVLSAGGGRPDEAKLAEFCAHMEQLTSSMGFPFEVAAGALAKSGGNLQLAGNLCASAGSS